MATPIHALALAIVMAAPGGGPGLFGRIRGDAGHHTASVPAAGYHQAHAPGGCTACQPGGRIVADGPGLGWGFKNDNPDGYGYVDYGDALPLGANRTSEYFFGRQFSFTPQTMFFPTYYNPYMMRGQRYVPYVGCGGDHPFGAEPQGSSMTPYTMDSRSAPSPPAVPVPTFTGRTEESPAGEVLPGADAPANRLDQPQPAMPIP